MIVMPCLIGVIIAHYENSFLGHSYGWVEVWVLSTTFAGLDSAALQVLASFWGPEQMQMLANHGISLVVPGAQKVWLVD